MMQPIFLHKRTAMKMLSSLTKISCFALFSFALLPSSHASSLKEILQHALLKDPSLDEARANVSVADTQTKISKAGHYPIISLNNTQMVAQKRKETENRRSETSVVGKVNLYSWGGIESEVERDKHKQGYYQSKFFETREHIGQRVGSLYLTALRAKESIAVYRESLARHQKILNDIQVIASYDQGRLFEVNEALTRRNQAESALLQQEKILYNSLSQLGRYTQKPLKPEDLKDPFLNVSAAQFISKFRNPDIAQNPTYQAQQKELESTKAAVNVAKAKRLPAINLEGSASRHERELYLAVSWDLFNQATKYSAEQSVYSQAAADAKLREIQLELEEKARTSEIDMARNQKLMNVTGKQISLQRKVVQDSELQFQIASKSLINLLDTYQELTSVQIAEVIARNDFRDAALLYLISQAKIADWAEIPNPLVSKK